MEIKNKKIFKILIMMLIPIFQPKIFTQYSSTTLLYIVLNVIEFILFILYFSKNEFKISTPFFGWIIYRIASFVVMFMNDNLSGILQWGYLSLMVINLFFVFEYSKTKYQNDLLKAICFLGTSLLVINLITILFFERGIIRSDFYDVEAGDYYFLGIKTQFTTMIFPTVLTGMLLFSKRCISNNQYFLIIVICLLNIFLKNISTAIIGVIGLVCLEMVIKKTKIRFNAKFLITLAILSNILVVFFNIQVYFSDFIENVLHKDASLSARIYIWDSARELISENSVLEMIFGNGIYKHNEFVPYNDTYWQPHNQLIVWLYSNGIFGTIFIIYWLYKLLNKNKSRNYIYQITLIVCCIELFLTITEVYFDVAVCYVPFLIAYYFTNIFNNEEVEIYE